MNNTCHEQLQCCNESVFIKKNHMILLFVNQVYSHYMRCEKRLAESFQGEL